MDKVEDIYEMFYNCRKLTYLNVRHFNTESCTDMSGMFKYCENLEYLDLSFQTQNIRDFNSMFEGCYNLKGKKE